MAGVGDEGDGGVQVCGEFVGFFEFDVGVVVGMENGEMGAVFFDLFPVKWFLSKGFHGVIKFVAVFARESCY